MTPRVRAPELTPSAGGGWLGSPPLSLAQLRGRFVLLDFWTSCCANCLHVIDELRPLESEFADVLTVIGVHSPKFPHEAEPAAVEAAMARNDVHHPVLNDPGLRLWQQYTVRAWPSLVLIDPEGYVVSQAAGEGHASGLAARLRGLVAEYAARGSLERRASPAASDPNTKDATGLRYPAKVILLPAGRNGREHDTLLVADAGHHQLTETVLDGTTVLRRLGTRRGEPFSEPNGLCLVPDGLADFDVVVANTADHTLRTVRLDTGAIGTIDLRSALAGAATVTGPVPAVPSPWDVAWWPAIGRLVVAAAGVHLLLAVTLDGRAEILAGTTVEGLRDGPARDAWLAQPSGLAVDGDRLWFVDAETSAARWLSSDGEVHTAAGEGLFDFGHVDGPAGRARFQHPLGVLNQTDRSVLVFDTYNGAVRRVTGDKVSTLSTGLKEPSGGVFVDGELVVVESAAHRLARPVLEEQLVDGQAQHTERPPSDLRHGDVTLEVVFELPPGRKLDDSYGPPVRVDVISSPAGLITTGAGKSDQLVRPLTIASEHTDGVLHVTAQVASCDLEAEHPACYLARQDWGIPVRVRPGGPDRIRLTLDG